VRVGVGSEGGEFVVCARGKFGREEGGQAAHHRCNGYAGIITSCEHCQRIQKPPARGYRDCKVTKKALVSLQRHKRCAVAHGELCGWRQQPHDPCTSNEKL
jgi:hypothetical protein